MSDLPSFPNENINVVLVVKNDEGQIVRRELHKVGVSFEMEVTEAELREQSGSEYIEKVGLQDLAGVLEGQMIGTPLMAAHWARSGRGDIVPEVAPVVEVKEPKSSEPTDVSSATEEKVQSGFKRLPKPEAPAKK